MPDDWSRHGSNATAISGAEQRNLNSSRRCSAAQELDEAPPRPEKKKNQKTVRQPRATGLEVEQRKPFSPVPSLWTYVDRALEASQLRLWNAAGEN